ncbi:D-alanine--D-alanine ligase [Actinobacillus equuli]|nr:D-alanine--D-alanine ligase [Actinobacillus equuli]
MLFGGVSQEREVSLNSGAAVTEALKSLGYNVEGIDTKDFPIEKLKEKGIQRVFNIYTAVSVKTVYYKVHWSKWVFLIPVAA